jgi:4-methyl-5(b-hydroxyethyl)-thiazole monophosphate biosynthesis
MKKVLVPIAEGFEEIEAITIIDVLRRGGIEVLVAGIGSLEIKGANGIIIKTDEVLSENISVEMLDMVVLPGGWGGTNILAENKIVQNLLKEMDNSQKMIGAICAAPFALKQAGVLKNSWTCYPSVEKQIGEDGYQTDKKVILDSNVMTSRGPATAIYFAIEIVRKLVGDQTADELYSGLLVNSI